MLAPRQPESHHVDENDDCHLGQDRVAQADGRAEGLVEPRPRVLADALGTTCGSLRAIYTFGPSFSESTTTATRSHMITARKPSGSPSHIHKVNETHMTAAILRSTPALKLPLSMARRSGKAANVV